MPVEIVTGQTVAPRRLANFREDQVMRATDDEAIAEAGLIQGFRDAEPVVTE